MNGIRFLKMSRSVMWISIRALAVLGLLLGTGAAARAEPGFSLGRGVNLVGNRGFYTRSTTWATKAGMDYYLGKGMRVFRIVVAWEWIQPKLGGDLDPVVLAGVRNEVDYLTAAGAHPIIDMHGMGRRDMGFGTAQPNSVIIGESPLVPASAFADLWSRVANAFKGSPNVIFNLMNEPHDQDGATLVATYNTVIRAIRATGATNPIMIDGNEYSGGWSWLNGGAGSNAAQMLKVEDPLNQLIFDVHQYLDDWSAGQKTSCNVGVGATALRKVTDWARTHHKRLFLGEFSSGQNATCYTELQALLAFLGANTDVWTGYAWWGVYAGQAGYNTPDTGFWYTIDPGGGDAQDFSGATPDDPRMKILLAGPK